MNRIWGLSQAIRVLALGAFFVMDAAYSTTMRLRPSLPHPVADGWVLVIVGALSLLFCCPGTPFLPISYRPNQEWTGPAVATVWGYFRWITVAVGLYGMCSVLVIKVSGL